MGEQLNIAIAGHLGRDEALADRLRREGHTVHAIIAWNNPGLMDIAQSSGGNSYHIPEMAGTPETVDTITDMVANDIKPDIALTNSSELLGAGFVNALRQRVGNQLLIPCPDKATSQIECDKFALRELVDAIAPQYNPEYVPVPATESSKLDDAIGHFAKDGIPIVVKPRGLTGGVGVKVMGPHFETYEEAKRYALEVLAMPDQQGVEIQEKLTGPEFTLQIFTDGKLMIRPPATYDYPYRDDGDTGPGTGGVGTFSMSDGLMPFLSQQDYDEAFSLSEQLLRAWQNKGNRFKGVWYGSFFKTPKGLKITEVNARGGDPEFINIADLLDDNTNLGNALASIATGNLRPTDIQYKKLASTVIQLFPPEYCTPANAPVREFTMNRAALEKAGCRVRFAAAERVADDTYHLSKTAKALGLSVLASTPWEAQDVIQSNIGEHFSHPLPLIYRHDVGDRAYIDRLKR